MVSHIPATCNASVWLFKDVSRLDAVRQLANGVGRARIAGDSDIEEPPRCLVASYTSEAEIPLPPVKGSKELSFAEETEAKRWYERQIFGVSGRRGRFPRLRRSPKVSCTAVILFKRFYLSQSIMEVDPVVMSLCCLFLASKIEDEFSSALELARTNAGLDDAKAKVLETAIFDHEVILLAGCNFDIRIAHPHRFFLALADKGDDPVALADAAEALLLTDAPLLYPPETLALAASLHVRHRQIPPAANLCPDPAKQQANELLDHYPPEELMVLLRDEDDAKAKAFDQQAKAYHKRLKKVALWAKKSPPPNNLSEEDSSMQIDDVKQKRGLKRMAVG